MSHNPNFSDDELEYIEPENLDTQRAFRQPTNAANSAQEPDALDDAPWMMAPPPPPWLSTPLRTKTKRALRP